MRLKHSAVLLALLLTAPAIGGCGDDETAPQEHPIPASAKIFVGGTDKTAGLDLDAGETVRAEIRFYDDSGTEITGIEDEHFAGLTFTPASLVTVADVADHHFQKDLTASGSTASGTVTVRYGHDEAADEQTFASIPVTVTGSPPGEV